MRTILLTLALLAPTATAWATECQPTMIQHPSGDPALEYVDFTAVDLCAAQLTLPETILGLVILAIIFAPAFVWLGRSMKDGQWVLSSSGTKRRWFNGGWVDAPMTDADRERYAREDAW